MKVTERGESVKTILARMGNIKIGKFIDDETSEDLSDVSSILGKFGIQLFDTEGNFRNFGDVLDEVASKWETYSNVEQSAIAVAFSGQRQRENFLVLMENYGKATEYMSASVDSAGTALEKFGAYEEGIEAKTKTMQASFEGLSQNFLDSDIVKFSFDLGNGIIQVVDKLHLLQMAFMLLGVATVVKGISALILKIDTFSSATEKSGLSTSAFSLQVAKNNAIMKLNIFSVEESATQKGLFNIVETATGNVVASSTTKIAAQNLALQASTAAMTKAQIAAVGLKAALGWIAIAMVAFTLLKSAFDYFYVSTDDLKKKTEETNQTYETSKTELESINTELEKTAARMSELNKMDSLTFVEEGELQKLRDATTELLIQQDVKKKELENNAAEAAKAAYDLYQAQKGKTIDKSTIESEKLYQSQITDESGTGSLGDPEDAASAIALYESALIEKNNLEQQYREASSKEEREFVKSYIQLQDDYIEKSKAKMIESVKLASNYLSSIKNIPEGMEEEALGIDWEASKKEAEERIDAIYEILDPVKGKEIKLSRIFEEDDFADIQKKLSGMTGTAKDFENELNNGNYKAFLTALGFVGLKTEDVAAQFAKATAKADEFSSSLGELVPDMDKLTELTSLIKSVNKDIEDFGVIQNSTINSIIKDYPQMTDALVQYQLGLKDNSEILNDLQEAYDVDYKNFRKLVIKKLSTDGEFYQGTLKNKSEEIDTISEAYDIDFSNFKSVEEAKLGLQVAILKQMGINQSKYAGMSVEALESLVATAPKSPFGAMGELAENRLPYKKELDTALEAARKAESIVNNLVFDDFDFDPSKFILEKDKNGKNGKEKDANLEAYKKEYEELRHLRSMDIINDQEYYDRLTGLDAKYFGNNKKYISEHRKNLEELYKLQETLANNRIADIEHENYLLEQQGNSGGTAEKQITNLKKIQNEYHVLAEKRREDLRSFGISKEDIELDDIIQGYQKKWGSAENEITSVGKKSFDDRLSLSKNYIEERNYHNDWGADSEIDAWGRVLVWLKEEFYDKDLISYKEYMKQKEEILHNQIEAQKEAMDSQISGVIDYIDSEIKQLEDEKKAIEDSNKEREKAITLAELEENLQKAKENRSVRIYRKDVGFVFEADSEEVNKAEKELEDFKNKDKIDKIDKEIDTLQELKDAWAEIPNSFQKEQDRLAAAQLIAQDSDAKNFEERIKLAQDFANRYNEAISSMKPPAPSFGGGNTGAYVPGVGDTTIDVSHDENGGGSSQSGLPIGTVVKGDNYDYEIVPNGTPGASYNPDSGYSSIAHKHANGTKNSGNEFANVDERGEELVAKAKQGRYTTLEKGSWVLPHKATDNIFSFGKDPEKFFQNYLEGKSSNNVARNYQPMSKTDGKPGNITFGNIILPNVQDANGFAKEIMAKLKNTAINLSFCNT